MCFHDIIASALYVHVGLMVVDMINAMCTMRIHLQYALPCYSFSPHTLLQSVTFGHTRTWTRGQSTEESSSIMKSGKRPVS